MQEYTVQLFDSMGSPNRDEWVALDEGETVIAGSALGAARQTSGEAVLGKARFVGYGGEGTSWFFKERDTDLVYVVTPTPFRGHLPESDIATSPYSRLLQIERYTQ